MRGQDSRHCPPHDGGGNWISRFGAPSGFQPDSRFCAAAPEPCDPIAAAYAEGRAAGVIEARAKAEAQAAADAEARGLLSLAFTRLDADLAEELRQRFRDTVAVLCEAALAPLTLDAGALEQRIARALAMFARADDERVVRLHPDDIALIAPRFSEQFVVAPDPTLARGSLRVETASGGVEDGAAQWRAAIAEALSQC